MTKTPKLCEVTWPAPEGVRLCQDGKPRPSDRVLDRRETCADCLEAMVQEAMVRTGQSRRMVLLAFKMVGKKGRDHRSKEYEELADAAGAQSGLSRQQIDELRRKAERGENVARAPDDVAGGSATGDAA